VTFRDACVRPGLDPDAGRSAGSASTPLETLIRLAISVSGNDREAAASSLAEASSLLRAQAPGHFMPVSLAPLTECSFRPGSLAGWQVKRVLAHIESHLGSKLSTQELASLVSLSKSHFSRAFMRSLGLPPMAYVAMRRVERARSLISSTRDDLSQIAVVCGFCDQSHLSRSFRRVAGLSPGRWRRNHADFASSGPGPIANISNSASFKEDPRPRAPGADGRAAPRAPRPPAVLLARRARIPQ
jgi:AraC family transcriptional regulator